MQHGSRLTGAASADEQERAPCTADTGGMERHQTLYARGESEDRELEYFVTRVIGEAEHVTLQDDQSCVLLGGNDGGAGRGTGAAQQSRTGQHRQRGRLF